MIGPGRKTIETLPTPRLMLDRERLDRNCAAMRERCRDLGVTLRAHMKTAKSLDVARIAIGGPPAPVTVSTLKEAAHFAAAGYHDVLYAVGMAPNKLKAAAGVMRDIGADLILVTDSGTMIDAADRFAATDGTRFSFLVEVDCGERRSGVAPESGAVAALATRIAASPHLAFRGVMTHAGHSYATDDRTEVRAIAARERDAIVGAAETVRAAGLACEIVSLGSTPTVMFADHLRGVTEVRCGIYMFWDLAQASRGICREDEIAVSVLASVIGHDRSAGHLVLDAGSLALSRDASANRFWPDSGFGYVCDALTQARCGPLAVNLVHQEHGTVRVDDPAWFDRLPVGSVVRILPNHACITCAAYESYDVVRAGSVEARWDRVNGW